MDEPLEEAGLDCPRCGARHEPDQEYCLECGGRLPGSRLPQPRPRLWLWAAGALAVVVAGAVVGLVAASEDGGPEAATPAAPTAAGESAPPETGAGEAFPGLETLTVPPSTDLPPVSGITETLAPPPVTTGPAAPTTTAGGLTAWPAGTDGYTVILASVPSGQGRAAAEAKAEKALAEGLPQVGVLDSSQYSSLRPGYRAVFSGVYTTLDQAQAALPAARAAGFSDAYTRRVAE